MGELFVVATPIGNLEDITLRALRILREVDYVLAEDTRRAKILFSHYQINTPLFSFHQYSSRKKMEYILNDLKSGKKVALISDSGTPLISDPGAELVGKAQTAGLKITPIPGPSALTTLLSVSGAFFNDFLFIGFLPKKKGREKKLSSYLEFVKENSLPIVLFEAPYRVKKLLLELKVKLGGESKILLGRELTKFYEEIIFSTIDELANKFQEKAPKGEIALIIFPKTK